MTAGDGSRTNRLLVRDPLFPGALLPAAPHVGAKPTS